MIVRLRAKGHKRVKLLENLGPDAMTGSISTFIQSALFTRTFRDGMALVEETANYLDGEGREISKSMDRSHAMSYASASMRLTTQLMQIASWLLVLRALREGDMTIDEASDNKYRIRIPESRRPRHKPAKELPETLLYLITRSDQLFEQIARLDKGLFANEGEVSGRDGAMAQQEALFKAFAQAKA